MLYLLFVGVTTGLSEATDVILVTGEWAPYTSEQMEGYGFFTEIISAVFNEMGMTPQYEFYPWKRCELQVTRGQAFAAFPYVVTEERQQEFDFSDVVAFSTGKFFYNTENITTEITYDTFADLKPYLIGGTLGYWYETPFKEAQLNVDYANSDEQSINKLYKKRVDLVPLDELVGWDLIKRLFPNETHLFKTVKKPLNQSNLFLLVSRTYPGAPELLKQFNQALAIIRQNGIYQQILQKYGLSAQEGTN